MPDTFTLIIILIVVIVLVVFVIYLLYSPPALSSEVPVPDLSSTNSAQDESMDNKFETLVLSIDSSITAAESNDMCWDELDIGNQVKLEGIPNTTYGYKKLALAKQTAPNGVPNYRLKRNGRNYDIWTKEKIVKIDNRFFTLIK